MDDIDIDKELISVREQGFLCSDYTTPIKKELQKTIIYKNLLSM